MSEHFLTNIDIEEFKCFKNFSASGFKRVNLIGGKNNIGKTAFMEACYIHVHSQDIDTMITAIIAIKTMRENINLLEQLIQKEQNITPHSLLDATRLFSAVSNIDKTNFYRLEEDAIKIYSFYIKKNEKKVQGDINILVKFVHNIKFIDNFGWSDDELIQTYQEIQKQDQERLLNNVIKEFDDSIEAFKVIGDKPQCKINGEYRDITEFGDGLKHYISIICALYACSNGYLFIDEIDNGIHYSQLDRLWELIFTLSKTSNCQVFASTHSKEMLEAFARVAKRLNEQDISYTTLVKNKQQEIKALTQDYEMLLYSIAQEHEVR
jgi:AAA15 family ATPase/GTPase